MMTKEHSHAQVLRWIADGKTVQYMGVPCGEEGIFMRVYQRHHPDHFTLAPRTIKVGRREINAPLDVEPEAGAIVHIVDTYGKALRIVWRKNSTDSELLAHSNVWATEADATAARDAWRELMKGQV